MLSVTWIVLFLGGALIPGLVGVLIDIIPVEQKFSATATSMACYNIIGFGAGAFLPGFLVQNDSTPSGEPTAKSYPAIQLIFCSTVIGFLSCACATYLAYRRI